MWIECESQEASKALRDALNTIDGVDAAEVFLKGGQIDARLIVVLTLAASVASASVAPVILTTLSRLGYGNIKISGKIVVRDLASIEGAIEANRNEPVKNPYHAR